MTVKFIQKWKFGIRNRDVDIESYTIGEDFPVKAGDGLNRSYRVKIPSDILPSFSGNMLTVKYIIRFEFNMAYTGKPWKLDLPLRVSSVPMDYEIDGVQLARIDQEPSNTTITTHTSYFHQPTYQGHPNITYPPYQDSVPHASTMYQDPSMNVPQTYNHHSMAYGDQKISQHAANNYYTVQNENLPPYGNNSSENPPPYGNTSSENQYRSDSTGIQPPTYTLPVYNHDNSSTANANSTPYTTEYAKEPEKEAQIYNDPQNYPPGFITELEKHTTYPAASYNNTPSSPNQSNPFFKTETYPGYPKEAAPTHANYPSGYSTSSESPVNSGSIYTTPTIISPSAPMTVPGPSPQVSENGYGYTAAVVVTSDISYGPPQLSQTSTSPTLGKLHPPLSNIVPPVPVIPQPRFVTTHVDEAKLVLLKNLEDKLSLDANFKQTLQLLSMAYNVAYYPDCSLIPLVEALLENK
eukprot:TRINITY_DN3935_c0_g2_i1.p1 TRINITY_DN3935_c0_g2~~TRINITY_DN3935_c0_g2_i1.p1  ORF type:complete len:546 (-),score=100.13 TRINITY_DN3935_c0_g2_i1:17-1411(-)